MNLEALNESILARNSIKFMTNILSVYSDDEAQKANLLELTTSIKKNMKVIEKKLRLK